MTIKNKVMKMSEWKGSSVWYKVGCSCGGDSCDCQIKFEFDKDFGDVTINFYKNLMWADYWQNKWFWQRWWSRIKVATKVMFTGRTEVNGDFIIQGHEHLDAIIEAFNEGKYKLTQWQDNFEAEQESVKKHNEAIDNDN